jgi:methylglutaconyl-CoA hydratase
MLIITGAHRIREVKAYNRLMAERVVEVEREGAVAYIWLNRPELRNAFNPEVISRLREAISDLSSATDVRCVVIGGRGNVFCAGADLAWMKEMAAYSAQENLDDARRLALMLRELDSCIKPVIARVQRAAFVGALGIMACCDAVICTDDCVFSFSEVRLGISPATIAPYVVAKTGAGFAREVMLSGKRFDARRAYEAGWRHRWFLQQSGRRCPGEIIELQAGPLAGASTVVASTAAR